MIPASKGRILIADDEQTFVLALADLLRREGYECQTVPDGLAAAAELNTTTGHQRYDLLIADINMQGNPNLELIRHLAEIAEGLPVILVTAYPKADTAIQSAELPVLAYMIKPVRFPELLPLVRQGVSLAAIYRVNDTIASRLSEWSAGCDSMRSMLSKGANGGAVTSDTFKNLSMRYVVGCLSDLRVTWRQIAENDSSAISTLASIEESLAACMKTLDQTVASGIVEGYEGVQDAGMQNGGALE